MCIYSGLIPSSAKALGNQCLTAYLWVLCHTLCMRSIFLLRVTVFRSSFYAVTLNLVGANKEAYICCFSLRAVNKLESSQPNEGRYIQRLAQTMGRGLSLCGWSMVPSVPLNIMALYIHLSTRLVVKAMYYSKYIAPLFFTSLACILFSVKMEFITLSQNNRWGG